LRGPYPTVCRASILAEELRISSLFSSQSRERREDAIEAYAYTYTPTSTNYKVAESGKRDYSRCQR
jgi:hypothetical protein